ncbi:MAG: hypothetical protein DRJ05_10580, partial [Bacteroidetes bacterium]
MKKLHFILVILIATSTVFYSCAEEENNDPPTISLKSGIDSTGTVYINMDTTLTINESFLIGVTANSNSEKNLKKLIINRKFESSSPEPAFDTTFSALTFTVDKIFSASNQPGTEDWTFTISDVNENSSSLNFRITTEDPPDELYTYENIEFGPYGDTLPNFFS